MSVNHSARSGGIKGYIFDFCDIKVCFVFSLESPHLGDSNEYTKYTIFNIKKKIAINYPKSAAMGFFQVTQNKFETAMVNEPSVFEPLKFYCICFYWNKFFPLRVDPIEKAGKTIMTDCLPLKCTPSP